MVNSLKKICITKLKYSDFIVSKNVLVHYKGITAAVKMMPVDTCEGVRFLVNGELVNSLGNVKLKIENLSKVED